MAEPPQKPPQQMNIYGKIQDGDPTENKIVTMWLRQGSRDNLHQTKLWGFTMIETAELGTILSIFAINNLGKDKAREILQHKKDPKKVKEILSPIFNE